jgi:hypothetical protein
MLNEEEQGQGIDGADFDWMSEWWKANRRGDARLRPAVEAKIRTGAGRRMRHPYLDPIVYPRIPDQTHGFDHDVLVRPEAVTSRNLQGTVLTDFSAEPDDTLIREIWLAEGLSTFTAFFRELHRYRQAVLPADQFISWEPRDRTWKRYAVQLVDVRIGDADEYHVETLGKLPYLMRSSLTIVMKTVRSASSPTGLLVGSGA